MGFMGTVGHFFLILAYQRAPGVDAHALPLRADRLRHARRLAHVLACARRDSLVGIALIAVCGAAGAWLTVRERRQERKLRDLKPNSRDRSRRGPSSTPSSPIGPSLALLATLGRLASRRYASWRRNSNLLASANGPPRAVREAR